MSWEAGKKKVSVSNDEAAPVALDVISQLRMAACINSGPARLQWQEAEQPLTSTVWSAILAHKQGKSLLVQVCGEVPC